MLHTRLATLAALATLSLASAAHATTWDVGFNLDEDAGDFGIGVNANAGVYADTSASICQDSWNQYNMCVDMFTNQGHSPAMVDAMCMPFYMKAEQTCAMHNNHFSYGARAWLDFDAEIFGVDLDVLRLYGGGGLDNDEVWGNIYAQLLGFTVDSWSSEDDALITVDIDLLSIPIVGVGSSGSLSIAGISVSVEAEAGGSMGVSLGAELSTDEASITLTPAATVGATASVSVDIIVAGFGVTGEATLVEVGTPASAAITHDFGTTFTISYGLDIAWTALAGVIEVWLNVLGIEYSETIIESEGFGDSYPLFSSSTTITL